MAKVTAKTKQETRERILDVSRKLFQDRGLSETTTRDVALRAGIATGTLFNYFPTKEALALTIVQEALNAARGEFQKRLRGEESLDELLFAHIACSLRHLRPHRAYVAQLLEGSLSPYGLSYTEQGGRSVRLQHLETVRELLESNGPLDGPALTTETLHLYWTLFLGVVSYWAADRSPQQENTLVLLDQSMKLFVRSLTVDATSSSEGNHGT